MATSKLVKEVLVIRNLKKRKHIIIITTSILTLIVVFLVISSIITSPIFTIRILTRFDSSINDSAFFPSKTITKSEQAYHYSNSNTSPLSSLEINYKTSSNKIAVKALSDFVISTDTTSFIIVKDDKLIYEQYANGYERDSINTSFSMAKSIDSLLIGKAIEDGYIKSEEQSIADYIEEFKGTDMEHITIKDLLLMRSDISYEETGFLWFRDDAYTYWMPDLRTLALNHTSLTNNYKGRMHYNNYHPLLLGIILERSTGTSVSEYFEKSIWQKIGTEYDASWSLDSTKTQFEKMESGINFRSIDFIKIGSMLLNNGYWNGEQIINKDWISKSTLSKFPIDNNEYIDTFIENKNIGYKYMWYSKISKSSDIDYMAWGKYNQMLYISPSNNTVILRTGISDGGVLNLPEVMEYIADYVGQ